MKTTRQAKILELIQKKDVETQEELSAYLEKEGFQVTQATVSRDIRELKLTKISTDNGRQKYAVITDADSNMMEWGIVRGNDLYMYGDKLKASLIKGAGENVFTAASRAVSENTSKNTKYPNPVTGWGTLCLLDSIP